MSDAVPRRSNRGRQAEASRNDALVLAAARDVFIEQGWDAPMSAIAKRAGIGVATIYRRYPSKTELIRHMCAHGTQQAAKAARAAVETCPGAADALRRFLRGSLETRWCRFFVLAENSTTAELRQASLELRDALGVLVADAHREGVLRDGVTASDIYNLLAQVRPSGAPSETRIVELQLRYLDLVLGGVLLPQDGTRVDGPLHGSPPEWPEISFIDDPPV